MTEKGHTKNDRVFMSEALSLASNSKPSPNPRVGAVLVKDGEVVGRGFHKSAGMPHAEIEAIRDAGEAANGADLYVTLEPCCHTGKTGPCTESIHNASIRRVVVGMLDPDRKMRGKGIAQLEQLGHQIELGVMKNECMDLLSGYTIHRTLNRPEIILKAAVSLDGFLASTTGDSKWISSKESRVRAHSMRAFADGVLVGANTVLTDDPLLNVRHVEGISPLRIVMDSSLRISLESNLVKTAGETPLIVAYVKATANKIDALDSIPGVETLACPKTDEGHVDPVFLAHRLAERGVLSLLVEGGGLIHGAFARAGIADRISLFVAPKLLGNGRSWMTFAGTSSISQAISIADLVATPSGIDLLVEGSFRSPSTD